MKFYIEFRNVKKARLLFFIFIFEMKQHKCSFYREIQDYIYFIKIAAIRIFFLLYVNVCTVERKNDWNYT